MSAINDPALQRLWQVAETDDVGSLQLIVASGVDVNAANVFGTTALMRAAVCGRTQVVRKLLENGADPNLARNDKFTALLLAAFFGHGQIVETLVEHGAKTDAVSSSDTCAKMWAASRTFQDIVDYLEHPTAHTKNNADEQLVTEDRSPAHETFVQANEPNRPSQQEEELTFEDWSEEFPDFDEPPRYFVADSTPIFGNRTVQYAVGIGFMLLVVIAGLSLMSMDRLDDAKVAPAASSIQPNPAFAMTTTSVGVPVIQVQAERINQPTNPQTSVQPVEQTKQEQAVTRDAPLKVAPVKDVPVQDASNKLARNMKSSNRQVKVVQTNDIAANPAETKVSTPAVTASTTQPNSQPVTARNVEPTTKPAAETPQLISPSKSASKGRTIQWP